MKYLVWAIACCSIPAMAQTSLTLENCYQLAQKNYPLIKQRELITKAGSYTVANAAKGYLPQLTFTGQATYQSQVVEIAFPGAPQLSKDQYKVQAEVSQTLFDGGNVHYQKELSRANTAIQQQQLEVNLYNVKDRISQLFFGILLIDEQLRQNQLRREDIASGAHKTAGAVNNGTSLRSHLDELKAELLNADQLRIQLNANRTAYLQMLALFINQPLDERTVLIKPEQVNLSPEIRRPELALYDYQQRSFTIREKQLKVNYLPKISAFVQGSYGRPTLNFVGNDFGFYGLGGIRFNWALGSLYTNKNSKQLLHISRQDVEVQKETFLFNTRLTMTSQQAQAAQYNDLIQKDQEIIDLRSSVKKAAMAQLENGVITSHDYISQVNAENQARLALALHDIQLLQIQYNHKNTSGN
ncbi:TolC family protein [Chitinophaga agri]|uniref:TolC family protein n=2 Tax=Chitinophaga agri TaxID=2703787 RepID=A0A6B9ZQX5_9BACT|nr:TolC family protein [Chitinophaga agri]